MRGIIWGMGFGGIILIRLRVWVKVMNALMCIELLLSCRVLRV